MDFPTKNSDRTNKNHGVTLQWWVFSFQMWRIANNFTGNWTKKMGNVTDWWFNKHFEGGRATLTRAHYNNYNKILGLWCPMHKQLRAFNCMQELGGMQNYRIRPLDMVRQKETCPTIALWTSTPTKMTKRGPICRIVFFPWKQGKMMGHSVRPQLCTFTFRPSSFQQGEPATGVSSFLPLIDPFFLGELDSGYQWTHWTDFVCVESSILRWWKILSHTSFRSSFRRKKPTNPNATT